MKKSWNDSKQMLRVDERIREKQNNRFVSGYYEDYITYSVPKEKGKGIKIVRVYAGWYHYLSAGNSAFRTRKAVYGALWLAAAALFVLAATRNIAFFSEKPSVFLHLMTILAFGWSLVDLISYILAPFLMTEYAFKSFRFLKAAAWSTAIMLCADAAAVLLAELYRGGVFTWPMAVSVMCCLCGAGAMTLLGRIEHTAVYAAFESEDRPPEGAEKIV